MVYSNGVETQTYSMDEILENVFGKLYPVGSLYITSLNDDVCPIQQFIPNSKWKLVANDQCLQGTNNVKNAGKEIEAAIPNITGTAGIQDDYMRDNRFSRAGAREHNCIYGAFYPDFDSDNGGYDADSSGGHGSYNQYILKFDASNSNSNTKKVYKDGCNTVQPPALIVCVWKRTA